MKRNLFTLAFLAIAVAAANAQYFPLDTARLNNAYRAIVNGENSKEKQQEFLDAFPGTWLEYTLTYMYSPDKDFDTSMSQRATEHCTVFADSLYLINDTTFCNKYIELVIGLNDTGENCIALQEGLHAAMSRNGDIMMELLSRKCKGHQLQFWAFYWSSTAESNWAEEFPIIYEKYKESYPEECRRMLNAFENFEAGIEYPDLLPHIKDKSGQ